MAKRLTEKQKKRIISNFKEGLTIKELSKEFNCTSSTIVRNLKKDLGETIFKELVNKNKNFTPDDYSPDEKIIEKQNTDSNPYPLSEFIEISPVDFEIENTPRKELSSVPLAEVKFPKIVYIIVGKKIELEIKLLKDFPEWDFLPSDDLNRKTIEIFFDLNIAKRSCNKEQKVLKVPNTDVFRIAARFLVRKGISRIVCAENLIAL